MSRTIKVTKSIQIKEDNPSFRPLTVIIKLEDIEELLSFREAIHNWDDDLSDALGELIEERGYDE